MLVHCFHALGHFCKFVRRCKNLYRIGPWCTSTVTHVPIQSQSQIQNLNYDQPQQFSPPTAQVFQVDQTEVLKNF